MTRPDDEYLTRVVRMFPGWADTVIWFHGPVPYAQAGLADAVVAELVEWERSYYRGILPEYHWSSPELAHEFALEGIRLAEILADHLGTDFEVELRSHVEGVQKRRFGSVAAALSPDASSALHRIADAAAAERERIRRDAAEATRRGEVLYFAAYAPLSGETFRPKDWRDPTGFAAHKDRDA